MKTEQEQIEKIVKILLEATKKCFDTDCNHCDYQYEKDCNQYRKALALVQAGYGDVSEYKNRFEVADKVLTETREKLTKAEHDRDRYKAEIERLRTTLGQCNTELNSALESLKSQCREIGELKAKVKQGQIYVLNDAKDVLVNQKHECLERNDLQGYNAICECEKYIDELIKEVEEQ